MEITWIYIIYIWRSYGDTMVITCYNIWDNYIYIYTIIWYNMGSLCPVERWNMTLWPFNATGGAEAGMIASACPNNWHVNGGFKMESESSRISSRQCQTWRKSCQTSWSANSALEGLASHSSSMFIPFQNSSLQIINGTTKPYQITHPTRAPTDAPTRAHS